MLWPAAQEHPDKQYDPIGEEGIAILDDLLAKSFCLELPFGALLGQATRRIVELTANQFWILDALERHSRVAVSGGAGTGKTVIAFEKARKMAARGARTLLLCFNKGVVETLNAVNQTPHSLTIRTFHSLAGNICQQAGVRLDEPSDSRRATFYKNDLPNGLLAAIDKRPDLRFDAVIVDEAQDFEENWWVPIELLLNDPQISPLYVFYDDNQNIFHRQSLFLSGLPFPFQLTRNLRNAKSVFAAFAHYYVGSRYEAGTDLPGEVSFHAEVNSQAALTAFIASLINDDHIPPSQIAILSCRSLVESSFNLQQFHQVNGGTLIRCESVWRFKGLEAPVVVLTDIEAALDNREVLYTALSRAQVRLCITGFPGPLPVFSPVST
jgi:superfamily I DNA and RNA helicase